MQKIKKNKVTLELLPTSYSHILVLKCETSRGEIPPICHNTHFIRKTKKLKVIRTRTILHQEKEKETKKKMDAKHSFKVVHNTHLKLSIIYIFAD